MRASLLISPRTFDSSFSKCCYASLPDCTVEFCSSGGDALREVTNPAVINPNPTARIGMPMALLPVAEKVNPDAANVKPTRTSPSPLLLLAAIFQLTTIW
jgi:hypothetical protein